MQTEHFSGHSNGSIPHPLSRQARSEEALHLRKLSKSNAPCTRRLWAQSCSLSSEGVGESEVDAVGFLLFKVLIHRKQNMTC